MAYIFGTKHDIDNRSSALITTGGLIHRLKMSWALVHKGLKTRPPFSPTLRKFCILLHCQASQTELTEISKRNSTKLCQLMSSQSPLTKCRTEVGSVPPTKIGAKKLLHLLCFSTTSRLSGEYLLNKTWHKQSENGVGKYRGFLHRLKISWTLVHKRLKKGSEYSPTLREFCIVLPTRCTQKPNPTKHCQTGGNTWRWCEPNKVVPHNECKCNRRS